MELVREDARTEKTATGEGGSRLSRSTFGQPPPAEVVAQLPFLPLEG